MTRKGFTLIELLVVISIIGILVALSVFGIQGARQASRDAKRKADLELIRSGLEIYKSDCNKYPVTALFPAVNSSLTGTTPPASCATANTYIAARPGDPNDPTRVYSYISTDGTAYVLCASLEQVPSGTPDITGCGGCGTGVACNYKVTNP